MPELPEVETVRISLAEQLCGRTITQARAYRADLRFPFPENFAERLVGACVTAVYRWSKYLLLELDSGQYWLIHLGMSGQCRLVTPQDAPQKHDHLEVDFSENLRLHYRDPRRFGFMNLLDIPEQYPAFARLGREAIITSGTYPAAVNAGAVDADYIQQSCVGKRSSIKQFLFDQSIVAGLGNIYINEILWLVGIDPRTPCQNIPSQLFTPLAAAITEVLEQALRSGGSSLKDFVDTDGSLGYFQHEWKVYDRVGQGCTKPSCNGEIQRCVQNNRASFFCPEHQIGWL